MSGGLAGSVSRREWLASMLGAPLAASLIASGCDKPSAPNRARVLDGELLGPSMEHGHRLQRRDFTAPLAEGALAATEVYDALIVGGGPSGLAAAWELLRRGITNFRVLELERDVGGTSISGRSSVSAYPWGAHYLPLPLRENEDLVALLREMGVVTGATADGDPIAGEEFLVREPDERHFYRGFWYAGLYPGTGASSDDLAQLARFKARMGEFAAARDAAGRRAFAIPVDASSDDAEWTQFDRISADAWMRREGFTSVRLRWLCEYACRDDFGMNLATTSAWALIHYYAARMKGADSDAQDLLAWPDGNGAIVNHLRSHIGSRIDTGCLVADVSELGGRVRVSCTGGPDGRSRALLARRCIVAAPQFIARRIVAPLRDSPSHADAFVHGAWMVANLHLHDRPQSRGFAFAWDNVLYDSPSLGYVSATHQRGREFGPTVWTYYLPLTDTDARQGRQRLLQHSLHDWQEAVLADLRRAHVNLDEHVDRVDIWRWGHGMVQPRVGALWGGTRARAQQSLGSIHFAHSDLSGIALFEHAFHHGLRAAREVATALQVTT